MQLNLLLDQPDKKLALFGPGDKYLRMIRESFGVQLISRDDSLRVSGEKEPVAKAAAVLESLQKSLRRQDWLSIEDVGRAIGVASRNGHGDSSNGGDMEVYAGGKAIAPKTAGQRKYLEAIWQHDLTFCTGPAGTGKTYLAVAAAATILKRGSCKRMVLVRPAIEAGERLGFLPGDLRAKVNPYLQPLYDAMHDMMDMEQIKRFTLNDVIEVIPLAFMRGRTLNESVIILDEAQNTTPSQMLMFLTRLGRHSKMIVTGDTSQVDLPPRMTSGLVDALEKLKNVPGIGRVALERTDIVRHKLVQSIVEAYEPNPEHPV